MFDALDVHPWESPDNMIVLGQTQVGKTSVVREAQATTSRVSVWVNERGDKRVPNVDGVEARTLAEVRDAFANDRYRIEFLPANRNEAVPRLQEWLWRVAEAADRQLPIQVIVDEVDRVAPQSGKEYGNLPPRDAVRDFTSEGVKRNIKFVAMTQDPTTYDKKALRQSRLRLVFPMSPEQRSAVSDYDFRWRRIDDAPEFGGIMHDSRYNTAGDVHKASEEYA